MPNNINQAVILAGGRGSRLMPLTANCPKPMVAVNGVPFLSILLEQLHEFGIKRVLLLTGYLGEQIRDYYGDQYLSLQLTYSAQPAELDTAERLWVAQHLLEPRFLLLYSDNLLRFSFRQHLANWQQGDALQLLVQTKTPGNLVVVDNRAQRYDASRRDPAASFVELGFMLVNWALLKAFISAESRNLNQVIQAAIAAAMVGVSKVDAPYFSISDPARLALMARYRSAQKVLLLDRDGTINHKAPQGEYVVHWADFQFVDSTVTALQQLAAEGFEFIVITNQAGIGRGVCTLAQVELLHQQMCKALAEKGIVIRDILLCPHHWLDECNCRKPAPGLFYQCEARHQLDMRKLIYVGDDPRDVQAAANADAASVFLGEASVELQPAPSLGVFTQLPAALPVIRQFYQQQDL